tara:strand:- start:705 stop:998 length:294 start_codon:yes stop_codon:yes gene_type:complete
METLKLKNGSEHPRNIVKNIAIALGTLQAVEIYSLWVGTKSGALIDETPEKVVATLQLKGLVGRDKSVPQPVQDMVESGVVLGSNTKLINLRNPLAD